MSNTETENWLEARHEAIIDNLTAEQEDTLKNIHAEQYHGTDDEMPDDYENWLMELSVMDLEAYLEL